jgi:hypothetical protein
MLFFSSLRINLTKDKEEFKMAIMSIRTKVDPKWRIKLPTGLLTDQKINYVYLRDNEVDGIRIYLNQPCADDCRNCQKECFIAKVDNYNRVLIPQPIRDSISFYFFPFVMFVIGKVQDCIQLWPSPAQLDAYRRISHL